MLLISLDFTYKTRLSESVVLRTGVTSCGTASTTSVFLNESAASAAHTIHDLSFLPIPSASEGGISFGNGADATAVCDKNVAQDARLGRNLGDEPQHPRYFALALTLLKGVYEYSVLEARVVCSQGVSLVPSREGRERPAIRPNG